MTASAPLRALTDELVAAGVRDVVICPGSRSTPIALAVAMHPDLRVLVDLDERGAGFLALGLAKASRRPVGVVVTSGTAAANLLPAVVEADAGRVPLLLLTADRPPELRGRGAPQTIDQVRMFGRFVRWDEELPVPVDDPVQVAHVRHVVARAVATAAGAPAGPVHLDLAYREPLIPEGPLGSTSATGSWHGFTSIEGVASVSRELVDALARRIREARRPLIWCGPLDDPDATEAIPRLAAALGAPILADGLANLRVGPHDRSHVIARGVTIVRSRSFTDRHAPDLIIRFGGTPTSRSTLEWLATTSAEHVVVQDGGWDEPLLHPSTIVHAPPGVLASILADANEIDAHSEPGWLDTWRAADQRADGAIRETLAAITGRGEPFEGAVFAQLGDALPPGTILWVGSSMPVRDIDAFLPGGERPIRCLANRGANGIDGVVSSALGAATADAGPVVLVLGDLSFLHDLNALATARIPDVRITIVLIDNDGGGIFSFLPQATTQRPDVGLPARFEELLGTPHGTDLVAVARALGASVAELGPTDIGATVAAAIDRPGIQVLRLRTDRARNVALHRRVLDAAMDAIG